MWALKMDAIVLAIVLTLVQIAFISSTYLKVLVGTGWKMQSYIWQFASINYLITWDQHVDGDGQHASQNIVYRSF